MKNYFLLFIVTGLFFTSCSSGNRKEPLPANPVQPKEEVPFMAVSDSGIVHMTLNDGYGKVRLRKNPNQVIYVVFDSPGYHTLTGYVTSADSTANLRFVQIFLPDGEMDGPFGREIDYILPSDGRYKLSVGENMMAGDPWGGDFMVEIFLSENL